MTVPLHKKFLIVAVLLLVGACAALILSLPSGVPQGDGNEAASSSWQVVATPEVIFSYGGDWGLAVTPEQVLVKSYIPPCTEGFDFCLYYTGDAYAGTNFESAGMRIVRRSDLKTQSACLFTQPDGYLGRAPGILTREAFATSVFAPLGDAGAGHYAAGALYRLFFGTTCFEFETRIGETQFLNYPEGTIKEFTAQDRADVEARLQSLLSGMRISAGNISAVFPKGA